MPQLANTQTRELTPSRQQVCLLETCFSPDWSSSGDSRVEKGEDCIQAPREEELQEIPARLRLNLRPVDSVQVTSLAQVLSDPPPAPPPNLQSKRTIDGIISENGERLLPPRSFPARLRLVWTGGRVNVTHLK